MKAQLSILGVVVLGLISSSAGDDIVKILKDRYNNVVDKCFDPAGKEKAAYECSGIMIRGVNNNLKFAWSMSDVDTRKGAFSLTYLRSDQKFSSFPGNSESGLIVYPHLQTPLQKNKYKVFCSFPMNGTTNARESHGCGKSSGDKTKMSNTCDKQNITSFDDWKAHFKNIVDSRNVNLMERQCAFNMTLKSRAKYFDIALKANRHIQSHSKEFAHTSNELRMHAWSTSKVENLPIEAIFHLSGSSSGKRNAEKYQDEFYAKTTGQMVPIISIRLPTGKKGFEVTVNNRTPKKKN